MTTPEEKLREATARVQANREAARAAVTDQASGESQTAVQSSRAQQPPPTPQSSGEPS